MAAPPAGTPVVEACRDARERYELVPVLERDVVNHGDRAYPMYPAGSPLRIGVYRITRKSKRPSPDR